MTPREALVESVCVRERAALVRVETAACGMSLCTQPRVDGAGPSVKYLEGASSALAEVRRALKAVAEGPDAADEAHAVLREIRARWRAQCGTRGRGGASWAGYLAGGLRALDQLLDDDDEGHGAHDAEC